MVVVVRISWRQAWRPEAVAAIVLVGFEGHRVRLKLGDDGGCGFGGGDGSITLSQRLMQNS